MTNKHSRFSILPFFLALSACTSVSDFQAMHPYERAEKVCYNADTYKERQSNISLWRNIVFAQETIVSQGYKVHKSCNTVKVPSGESSCYESFGSTTCKSKMVDQTTCEERPVPINHTEERAALDGYRETLLASVESDRKLTGRCITSGMRLSPERAYELYRQDREN